MGIRSVPLTRPSLIRVDIATTLALNKAVTREATASIDLHGTYGVIQWRDK